MNRGSRRFPLIADDEPVMSPLVKMNLYDNEDLINNIRDFYQEKTYRKVTELSHLSDRLQQESYILAEIPIIFQEPDNTPNPKTKKNNFDFLKRSQVYNKQDNQFHKERAKAQELNLTRFKDIN